MSKTSPTQRTMRHLRHEGTTCAVVERWNQFAGPHGVRQDLFGFIDILALEPGRGIVAVQCCARSGHAAHRRKILEECTEAAVEWLRCGGDIEIWSWGKVKLRRGSTAFRWKPKVEVIGLDSFEELDTDG